jgi:hypothetical protein
MLPAHVGTSRSALAALQRDFADLRALDHPHIARLLELGCNGKQYYVTGERLDGEPLREVLTHLLPERLEVSEADDVVRAIGSALAYAHEHDVVHGDVRAENVLVTMDRRFMLTNFLARRVAKNTGRPPRPNDDLVGLARLAAELYTGSSSPHALRAAVHSGVPAVRLNAIRAVLETSSGRRSGGVTEFLAAAGLAFATTTAAARRAPALKQARLLWRVALPVAAVAAIGALVASYDGPGTGEDWRESATELQRRGLDALRTVAAKPTPPPPAESTGSAPDAEPTPEAALSRAARNAAARPVGAPVSAPATVVEPPLETPAEPPPERPTTPSPVPPAQTTPVASTPAATTAAVRRGDPAVLSMGVPRIAAREDHSVVAIDVVRSGDTTHQTSVGWWVTPGTAEPDDDYTTGGRQVVVFPPGATVQRVLIPIIDDSVREPDKVFTVHLSRPRDGVTGDVAATRVTLYDDD